jgi:hypothetical protein
MAKKFDPKAKAKRQKIFIAVGGVILLGLLAFQIPRTMKMLHPEDPPDEPPAAAAAQTTGSTPLGPPTLSAGGGGALASTGSASGDGVVDPDVAPAPTSGQLVSFSRFKSKDPFHQQIKDCGVEACNAPVTPVAPSSARPASASGGGGGAAQGGGVVPSSGGSAASPKPAPAPLPAVRRATISVNGVPEVVEVGKTFPADDPAFKLVSLTRKKATISIAGGSFESGAQAIALEKGKTVVLLNTADGARYELNLIATA